MKTEKQGKLIFENLHIDSYPRIVIVFLCLAKMPISQKKREEERETCDRNLHKVVGRVYSLLLLFYFAYINFGVDASDSASTPEPESIVFKTNNTVEDLVTFVLKTENLILTTTLTPPLTFAKMIYNFFWMHSSDWL